MTHTTKLLICIALCGVIYLCTPSARACEPPGPCYNWDADIPGWVATGCVATPCTDDCTTCNAETCSCEETCVDPNAVFDVTGYTDEEDIVVPVDTSLTFDAGDSYDPDDTTLTYDWSFGVDATNISGADTSTPSCSYDQGGVKTVTLSVTDNDNPDCSTECEDKTSEEVSRTLTVVEVASVSYLGDAEVWKGTEVTWQVETEPSGHYDIVSVSGIGEYDSVTGLVTYDCPTSSASSTTKFMDITATCGNSGSASDGPVVYHLVSAEVDPETICQGGYSQLDTVISPSDGGLVPTFSGEQIDAAGYIDGGTPAILSVGPHTYTAVGDTTKTSDLVVLTGAAGDWTLIKEALPFTYVDDPSYDYDYTETVEREQYFGPGVGWLTVGYYQYHKMGYMELTEGHDVGDTIQQNACGVGTEVSHEFSYSYGITFTSNDWHGVNITASVGVTNTWTETIDLPADPDKRLKKTLYIPKYEVEDQRGDWKRRYRDVGDDWPSTWSDDSRGDQNVSKSDILLVGGKFKTWGACCD